MQTKRLAAGVSVALLLGGVLTVAATGLAGHAWGPPDRELAVSQVEGTRPASPAAERTAKAFGAGGRVEVIGQRGGRTFYRVERDGRSCYGSGASANATGRGALGALVCPSSAFPSVGRPTIDLSIYEIGRDNRVTLIRLEGVAADQVATVRALEKSGDVMAEADVVGNVYAADHVGTGDVAEIVAYDDAGGVVSRTRVAASG